MSDNQKMEIPESFLYKWQNIVDVLAELINVPAGLIMRVVDEDIKVFVSSNSEGNPYKPGDHEVLIGSGLYCETVINRDDKLHIPDALKDEHWKNNPDIKLNMISYLGFPIHMPDKSNFGTICVLDNKENQYSPLYEKVMLNLREIIETDLKIVFFNYMLGEKNRELTDYIDEIKHLRGLLRICAKCKKIKNEEDEWIVLESYIQNHTEAEFSHGLCENCMEDLYGDKEWFKNKILKK